MLNIDYISYNHASEKEHSTTSILIKSQITPQSLIAMISLRFHINFFLVSIKSYRHNISNIY